MNSHHITISVGKKNNKIPYAKRAVGPQSLAGDLDAIWMELLERSPHWGLLEWPNPMYI
jgi:hypothetical protein